MAPPVLGGRWLLSTEQGMMSVCQRYDTRPQASEQQDQGVPVQQGGSIPQFLCSGGLGGFPAEAEQRRDESRSEEMRETAEAHKNEQSQQGLAPGHHIPVPARTRLSSMVSTLPIYHQGWSLDPSLPRG